MKFNECISIHMKRVYTIRFIITNKTYFSYQGINRSLISRKNNYRATWSMQSK